NYAFADKAAGENKAITMSGLSLTGLDALNYQLRLPSNLVANISKADLAVTGVTALNKVYDATTTAVLTGTATVRPLLTDDVTITANGVGTFINKNVGDGKTISVAGFTVSGADVLNYNLLQPTGLTANITKADLAVTGVTALNKVYDATTTAVLTGTATVQPLLTDDVTITANGVGTFVNKNVGDGKTISVAGFTVSGADILNYNLLQPTGLLANITKADLNISGLSAANKVYDATTSAVVTGSASITPLLTDAVSLLGTANYAFADKAAGENKAITMSGLSLTGLDALNYQLRLPSNLERVACGQCLVAGSACTDW
ncbi:MAG: YDG domain-containing protein, partial [Burkholderiales bacterium]|nr:YDG domain-containing protein [Burkholderiales bacterium]